MRYVKPMVLIAALVFSLALVGLQAEQAEAQLACCKVLARGLAVAEESFGCNTNTAQTRRLADGDYEVDFTVATVIATFVKLATVDTQGSGVPFVGAVGVADRVGDFSSVFVSIRDINGRRVNTGFNVCLFGRLVD